MVSGASLTRGAYHVVHASWQRRTTAFQIVGTPPTTFRQLAFGMFKLDAVRGRNSWYQRAHGASRSNRMYSVQVLTAHDASRLYMMLHSNSCVNQSPRSRRSTAIPALRNLSCPRRGRSGQEVYNGRCRWLPTPTNTSRRVLQSRRVGESTEHLGSVAAHFLYCTSIRPHLLHIRSIVSVEALLPPLSFVGQSPYLTSTCPPGTTIPMVGARLPNRTHDVQYVSSMHAKEQAFFVRQPPDMHGARSKQTNSTNNDDVASLDSLPSSSPSNCESIFLIPSID
jgi:hypothetical protein